MKRNFVCHQVLLFRSFTFFTIVTVDSRTSKQWTMNRTRINCRRCWDILIFNSSDVTVSYCVCTATHRTDSIQTRVLPEARSNASSRTDGAAVSSRASSTRSHFPDTMSLGAGLFRRAWRCRFFWSRMPERGVQVHDARPVPLHPSVKQVHPVSWPLELSTSDTSWLLHVTWPSRWPICRSGTDHVPSSRSGGRASSVCTLSAPISAASAIAVVVVAPPVGIITASKTCTTPWQVRLEGEIIRGITPIS